MIKSATQRGIGLLELMMVIAISAILIVMGVRYYQATERNEQVSQAVALMRSLMSAATTYANSHSGDLSAFSVANALATGEVDREFVYGSKIKTPFGNSFNASNGITGTAGSANAVGTYTITWPSLPDYACNQLVNTFKHFTSSAPTSCNSQGKATASVAFTFALD